MGALILLMSLFALVLLHEVGHILAAILLDLPVQKVGFQLAPYPRFYVSVRSPVERYKALIYLFSGTFVTIALFVLAFFNGFLNDSILYWAFVVELVVEFNPFYSDFTIAVISSNMSSYEAISHVNNYKKEFNRYQYSMKWYFHFILWVILIVCLIRLKGYLL